MFCFYTSIDSSHNATRSPDGQTSIKLFLGCDVYFYYDIFGSLDNSLQMNGFKGW